MYRSFSTPILKQLLDCFTLRGDQKVHAEHSPHGIDVLDKH